LILFRKNQNKIKKGSGDFIYDGEWCMGRRSGKGRAVWHARRESYAGDFEDGDFHGTGVHASHDGDVYQGEFVKGRRSGVGTLQKSIYNNNNNKNAISEGTVSGVNAVWTRQGVRGGGSGGQLSPGESFQLPSVTTLPWTKYTGEWCDGVREGVGTCNFVDGSTYTGSWRFDQPFGEGDFKNGDGTYHFVGEWQYGLRHGEAKEEVNVKEQFSANKLMKFSREGRWERDEAVAGDWCLNWWTVTLDDDDNDGDGNDQEKVKKVSPYNNSNTVLVSSNRFDMHEAWYGEGNRSYVGLACEEGLAEGIGTMKYKNTGAVYSGEVHYITLFNCL
jgi:hypothetical protein